MTTLILDSHGFIDGIRIIFLTLLIKLHIIQRADKELPAIHGAIGCGITRIGSIVREDTSHGACSLGKGVAIESGIS